MKRSWIVVVLVALLLVFASFASAQVRDEANSMIDNVAGALAGDGSPQADASVEPSPVAEPSPANAAEDETAADPAKSNAGPQKARSEGAKRAKRERSEKHRRHGAAVSAVARGGHGKN